MLAPTDGEPWHAGVFVMTEDKRSAAAARAKSRGDCRRPVDELDLRGCAAEDGAPAPPAVRRAGAAGALIDKSRNRQKRCGKDSPGGVVAQFDSLRGLRHE